MASEHAAPPDHLIWQSATVRDHPVLYGVAGSGIPLLFLHGWGLAHHAYKRPLKRLVQLGCRVFAPAQPGFGGTPDLPKGELTLAGYAAWIDDFLTAVGVTEPLIVVGHSFGGGVAIQLAHDFPKRMRSLVLVNSIGGSAWSGEGSTARKLAERPIWDWGLHFPSDLLPVPQITKVLPAGFETLRSEAQAEGYRHLDRLAADWASGALRFDRPGEALHAGHLDNELAAVGGLTIDPAVPGALRMRRFYVGKRFRRCGIGRRLATALLERAAEAGRPVTVNAAAGSAPFWTALGFTPDPRDGHTHVLERN